MINNKYLIYLDILGFENLAAEISKKKGIDTEEVRGRFIDVISERIAFVDKKGILIGKKYGNSDDWILVANSLNDVFKAISDILDHKTSYENFREIPSLVSGKIL